MWKEYFEWMDAFSKSNSARSSPCQGTCRLKRLQIEEQSDFSCLFVPSSPKLLFCIFHDNVHFAMHHAIKQAKTRAPLNQHEHDNHCGNPVNQISASLVLSH